MRPVVYAPGAVQMLTHEHTAFGQRASPLALLDLQRTVLSWFTTRSCWTAKMRSRSFPQAGIKAISRAAPPRRKISGELGDVALALKAVGLLRGGDAAQPQLLRQPPLPGAEVTLAASARLRRCGPRLGALLTSPAACGSSLMQV